jgi:cyclic pyranopterin phosphate synthase
VTLSHLDGSGRARMVDVGRKPETPRRAIAEGSIRMSREAFEMIEQDSGPKGTVLSTVELAGVMAAKRTGELIPLCHPIGLDNVRVHARLAPDLRKPRSPHRVRYGEVVGPRDGDWAGPPRREERRNLG